MKESLKVLEECAAIQNSKSTDYQNPNSTIKQADYYPHGCSTILDIIWAKVLRMRSVFEAMENDPNYKPNFESLDDSAKDCCNYLSFFVAYSRGGIDGQTEARDFMNRLKPGYSEFPGVLIDRPVCPDFFEPEPAIVSEMDPVFTETRYDIPDLNKYLKPLPTVIKDR